VLVAQAVTLQRLGQVAAAVRCRSGPSPSFSAETPSAASLSISTELRHASAGRLREATYLVASFSGLAPASSDACGQYAAKIW
jgi:hypothetical protein